MKTSDVDAALAEMDYKLVENMSGLELPASTPAQLSFTEPPTPDMDSFDDALDTRGFARLGDTLRRKDDDPDRWIFDTDIWAAKAFTRVSVKVWHDGCVRIYPREHAPSLTTLAALTRALEIGFDAPLEHDPLEDHDA